MQVDTRSRIIVSCASLSAVYKFLLTEFQVKILYCCPLTRTALTLTHAALDQARPLDFMTSSRCIPVKSALVCSAVAFCLCELAFYIMLCRVGNVRTFDVT